MKRLSGAKFRIISNLCLFAILIGMCGLVAHVWLKEFVLTTLSSGLLLALLLSLRNTVLRVVLVDLFFLVAVASFSAREIYTYITKDMILALVGVSYGVSVDLVQAVPAIYFHALAVFMLVISYLAYHGPLSIPGWLKFYVMPIPLFVLLLDPVHTNYQWLGYYWFMNNNMYQPTFMAQDYIDRYKIFWGDVVTAAMIGAETVTDEVKYAHVKHDKIPPYVTREGEGADKVIFVIGEASNVRRYGAFGYELPTTPNLVEMNKSGQICLVDKVHSATPTTRTAVPMYVSFATPQDRPALFNYKNIIEMAQANGYRTYWIDSQWIATLWDKTYFFVAKYADLLLTPKSENPEFVIREGKDDDLIAPLQHYFSGASKKSLFIVHLSGNHMGYDTHTDDADKAALPTADAYDQSVHHVDRILKAIKDEADKAFGSYQMVYLPDHGEAVNYGHGYATHYNEMFLIPLLANDPAICAAMEKMRGPDGYVSSDTVKYAVLEMLGYKIDGDFLQRTASRSFEILNGYEQISDFRKLDACPTKDCPN